MKKLLYIILGIFIYKSSFSQQKEIIFLDAQFNNVNNYLFERNKKERVPAIRMGKRLSDESRIMIYYYVEYERDMNGDVVNEVKLYRAKRYEAANPLSTPDSNDKFIKVVDFFKPDKRRGTIAGRGFVSKIDIDDFTNSIFKEQWREFYINGNLKKVIPYNNNGIKDGIYEEYFEDGELKKKIYYVNGEIINHEDYYEDGELKKKINYVNGEIINVEYNIDINNNLKDFSDEIYIKAYIEKDGIDELEGLYECSAHIPIRGRNHRGIYTIAIVSSKKSFSTSLSNYTAYILEASCKDCSGWEKGDVLAIFKERESGEFDIYWNHPWADKNNLVVYPTKGTKGFGNVNYAQIFWTKFSVENNKELIFDIRSEFVENLEPRVFYDDESVTLNRIWPKSDIDASFFSNQKTDSSKDSITIEEATAQLKELKELLELGLITEKEFEKKSEELKKIILK